MDFNQFILWVLNAGGSIAIVSWIAEQIPAFGTLDAAAKKWIFFVASALVSGGAYAVLTYAPADLLAQLAPIFQILYVVFTTVFASNAFHKVTKR